MPGVEGGRNIHFLREKGAIGEICRAVNHIKAVDAGYSYVFHGCFLYAGDELGGLLPALGLTFKDIQDRSDFPASENAFHLGFVKPLVIDDEIDVQLDHLPDLGVEVHSLERLFHFCFDSALAGYKGADGHEDQHNNTVNLHIPKVNDYFWNTRT